MLIYNKLQFLNIHYIKLQNGADLRHLYRPIMDYRVSGFDI